jgi:hypothetical protein
LHKKYLFLALRVNCKKKIDPFPKWEIQSLAFGQNNERVTLLEVYLNYFNKMEIVKTFVYGNLVIVSL